VPALRSLEAAIGRLAALVGLVKRHLPASDPRSKAVRIDFGWLHFAGDARRRALQAIRKARRVRSLIAEHASCQPVLCVAPVQPSGHTGAVCKRSCYALALSSRPS
jgi:hypothetical protein